MNRKAYEQLEDAAQKMSREDLERFFCEATAYLPNMPEGWRWNGEWAPAPAGAPYLGAFDCPDPWRFTVDNNRIGIKHARCFLVRRTAEQTKQRAAAPDLCEALDAALDRWLAERIETVKAALAAARGEA